MFWNTLKKPFFVMAPMADVTDPAFRALVARCGAPDVSWTEFVSADGLYHTREIQKMPDSENPLMRALAFGEAERPIVAQIFSSDPEMIAYATRLIAELGFDGVDLNMGCPDRSIEKQGCGAAMIQTPEVARAVIRAAKSAAAFGGRAIPVSVKTRVGYATETLDEWLPVLLEEAPAVITIHLRTRKQLSLVPANWEWMKKAVAIRDRINPSVLLIGNGDVTSVEQGRRLVEESGCDGAMIGRGMFGNPWLFSRSENSPERSRGGESGGHLVSTRGAEHSLQEKLEALTELAHDFEKMSSHKSFSILKKHIKAFVTGFSGAADLRARLMEANSAAELEAVIAQNKVRPLAHIS